MRPTHRHPGWQLLLTLTTCLCAWGCAHGHEGHRAADRDTPHRFEDAEQWAKHFDDPARDAWQMPDEVVRLMALEEGMSVADLGAGTGYFLPHLSRAVGSGTVLGLDVEASMVAYMTERAQREHLDNVEARVVGFDDPGLAAASVDRVLIVNTWHHIEGREAYGAKLLTGLKEGGAVVVVDFKPESERGPKHKLEAQQVVDELRAAGMQAELMQTTLPDQYVVMGRAMDSALAPGGQP